jgi:glycosyltransferase involved in cell wall biosynthesis
MKPKLLIINQKQFGYHIDTYQYCYYLHRNFQISYICWDYERPKFQSDKIRIIYISRRGNLFIRNFRYINALIQEINQQYHIHFIKYFKGCSLLRLKFINKKFILDIRTGSVEKNKLLKFFFNTILWFETLFFKHITIVSKELKQQLGIKKSTHLLPLGADIISQKNKDFSSFRLLYVGTFNNRNIEQTILGFEQFYKEYKKKISLSYTIIGSGDGNEENSLRKLINKKELQSVVQCLGYIKYDNLRVFFDNCNVGIAYIPITSIYQYQPPTKVFEYIFSGLFVIATKTFANQQTINQTNGILIEDDSQSFYQALKAIYSRRHIFHSDKIRASISQQYLWHSIVKDNLKVYLDMIIKN